jgi:hypothetical protein
MLGASAAVACQLAEACLDNRLAAAAAVVLGSSGTLVVARRLVGSSGA